MIVADTNLVAAFFLNAPDRVLAQAVFARDPHWAAPLLWRSEMRNVLAGAMRRSELTLAAAEVICAGSEALLDGRQHHVDDGGVLQRAVKSGCTAYDCEFVALAEELRVPLVTFDRQVLAAFPATAIHPERFGSGAFWGDRVSEAMELFGPGGGAVRRGDSAAIPVRRRRVALARGR